MSAIDALASADSAPVARDDDALTVEIIDSIDAFPTILSDYERLGHSCGNAAPFALYDWHVAWCAHFLNLDRKVEDRLSIYLMRSGSGTCVAIIPLVASRRRVGPVSIVTMDLLGADPSTTESRTPLIEAGYEKLTLDALRARLAKNGGWDWITWRNLSGPLLHALTDGRSDLAEPEAPGYLLELAPTWEQFRRGLKRNIRESLRHCYNSLKRDGYQFSIEIALQPPAVRLGIDRFLALHALRAGMLDTIKHPDHFSSTVSQQFLYDVCERLALKGVVRVFQLRVNAEVVAVRIGFVVGNSLYLYYSGFDPQWARYSVMTTTVAEAIKYAISQGLESVNLSRGTDPSKTRWGPRRIEYGGVLEPRDRLISRAIYAAYHSARSDRSLQAWLLTRLGSAKRHWR